MTQYTPKLLPFAPVRSADAAPPSRSSELRAGDRSGDDVYVFTDEIVLALDVALSTGRPLLVRGASGSGKTSLARSVATRAGWLLFEAVVTARTQARDLLWSVDTLRRLQDAQTGRLAADFSQYIAPGPCWWAFDPIAASSQQARSTPGAGTPVSSGARTVLLIDEIDKADPDVPNSLLRPLGDLAFRVEETGQTVSAGFPAPLVVLTTNEERDLPPAFLRRCVELNMPAVSRERLVSIGKAHEPEAASELLSAVADLVLGGVERRERREPNPAEYLDVLRACRELDISVASDTFARVARAVVGGDARGAR